MICIRRRVARWFSNGGGLFALAAALFCGPALGQVKSVGLRTILARYSLK